jgi:DNA-binding response OmpR family regulator
MRLLLIEDSVRLQESLRAGFTRAGFALDVVGDGRRGLLFAKREHYDVIVLDLMLPDLDGLELLRQLRAAGSEAQVLILTARHSVEDRVLGLQEGADDYLPKPFSFDELLARVQALVRRRYRSRGPEIRVGDLVVDTVRRRVTKSAVEVRLTRREFRILEYLARRKGETVTRVEIEDHVYGEENLPDSNTIESAICTIRRKLREADGSGDEPIQTRHGTGYCLDVKAS